ncbi:MAG: GyrI-like domain-containing protein [Anaerolineae bacterium]|nr:GyrI-like domain-containing protein [Anaerolineae bacterium]
METLDLKKTYKHLYMPSAKKVELVDVPALNFVMLDGAIEPGQAPGTSPLFEENMQALYGAAYTLKFMVKQRKDNPVDYPVMAMEGLWWVEDGCFDITVKDNWFYTVMILQPDLVTQDVFDDALQQLRKKKGSLPAFDRLRLETWEEGRCVQIMHVGPYATEPATIEKMRAFIGENGLQDGVGLGGKHHEIYLGDPRRAAPDKLKTVLRHPVKWGDRG